jgi:HNH endonuclease
MDRETQKQVRQRAENRCEYCRLHQDHSPLAALQIEHIIPRKHNGDDSRGNLALACIDCNQAKGSNIARIDPDIGRMSRLFHPRRDRWNEHFEFRGVILIGKTAVGRTTVAVLRVNSDDQIELRRATGQS